MPMGKPLNSNPEEKFEVNPNDNQFLKELQERWLQPTPELEIVKPVLTKRQKADLNDEMKRGREISAKHAEQQKKFPRKTIIDPHDGGTKTIFRPSDYTPDFNHGNINAKDIK